MYCPDITVPVDWAQNTNLLTYSTTPMDLLVDWAKKKNYLLTCPFVFGFSHNCQASVKVIARHISVTGYLVRQEILMIGYLYYINSLTFPQISQWHGWQQTQAWKTLWLHNHMLIVLSLLSLLFLLCCCDHGDLKTQLLTNSVYYVCVWKKWAGWWIRRWISLCTIKTNKYVVQVPLC